MRTERASSNWGFKAIDRYLITELVSPFVGALVFFSFIFLMFQALRLADFFIIHGVPGTTVLKLIGLLVLSFMPMALPIAFLLAVLSGFGRLSGDSELVAMKANGISLFRLTLPVILLGLAISGLSLWLNLSVVPKADHQFKRLFSKGANTQAVKSLQEGAFTSSFFGLLIFVDRVDSLTSRLSRVFIFDERQEKNELVVIGREGALLPVQTEQEFGAAAVLKLFNGNIHSNDSATGSYQKIDFEEYRLFLDVEEAKEDATPKVRMLDFRELLYRIKNYKALGLTKKKLRPYHVEFWRRIALASSPVVFTFLGIGFGTIRTRSAKASSALVAFIVVFFYWTLLVAMTDAAQAGKIAPPLALFMPNLILLAVSIPAYRSSTW